MTQDNDVSKEAADIRDTFESSVLKDARDDLANCLPRPNFGVQGRKIEVFANMFPVQFTGKENYIYHYDIVIEPAVKRTNITQSNDRKSSRELNWKIWKQLCAEAVPKVKEGLAAAGYDQHFFIPRKLELSKPIVTIPVQLKDEPAVTEEQKQAAKFHCTIQLIAQIDLNNIIYYCQGKTASPAIKASVATGKAAINVLLRQDLYDRFVPKGGQGRRFFTLDEASAMSGAGLVLNGFIQSFVPTQSGLPAVQLDTAYGPFFRSDNLLQLVTEIVNGGGGGGGRGRGGVRGGIRGGRGDFRGQGGSDGHANGSQAVDEAAIWRKREKLSKLFYGAKYTLTYRSIKRPFRIEGWTTQGANQIRLKIGGDNGQPDKMLSVSEYLKTKYNITLIFPDLPLIKTGRGNPPKLFPIELVNLTNFNGIPFTSVTSDQTAEMIKVAAKPPPQRQDKIMHWRKQIDYSKLPKLKEWCLNVSEEMMKVPARILEPPKVQYKGRSMLTKNGAWYLNDNKFARANLPLKAWSIACFDNQMQDGTIKRTITELINTLVKGDCIVQNRAPPIVRGEVSDTKAALTRAAKSASEYGGNTHPQLIIVIVPRTAPGLYQTIKRTATNELHKPVVTQIMLSIKILNDRGLQQYLSNVGMKVHSKLGGVTHAVTVPQTIDKTTMIVGADVTHPPPSGKDIPLQPSIAVSIAAVNGANDMFVPCIRLQKGRREMIEDLTEMMKSHIRLFEKRTGSKPQKILFFRDGVSEGQYDLCVDIEVKRIKQAFSELDPHYHPKLTMIICAKRHHMRFFATKQGDTDGKTGNLIAGTCVDSHVTHPYAFDFYLQAHAGLQGTARPTHYVVVVDENKFTADKMQNLCNDLCYSYARSTRAVSLVPVCYYADLIAWKARDFVYPDDNSDTGSVVTGSSGTADAEFDAKQLYKRLETVPQFNEVMWYM